MQPKIGFLFFFVIFNIFTSSILFSQSKDNDNFYDAVQAVKNKDYKQAIILFQKEADDFQFEAQYNLALLLKSGKGKPKDYSSALFWSRIAQLGGIDKAEELADEISSKITKDEVRPILDKIEKKILNRINTGDFEVIPLIAKFYSELIEEKDYENAYIWYSIASALDIPETSELRDEMENKIESENLLKVQSKSNEMFNDLLKKVK